MNFLTFYNHSLCSGSSSKSDWYYLIQLFVAKTHYKKKKDKIVFIGCENISPWYLIETVVFIEEVKTAVDIIKTAQELKKLKLIKCKNVDI
jgi:hypothetical protein